ncbi:MAG: CHAT domain-containing protein [Hormoscilla sp. GM7CHS1pb]|nr:CHAT domain-containing protein [Hormoscilla sp. GM7CHS1pb]
MSQFEYPTLSIAIARMMATAESFNIESAHFAIWVLKAPYSAGHVHHDCIWPKELSRTWEEWQEMFQMQGLPQQIHVPPVNVPEMESILEAISDSRSEKSSSSSWRMQKLGMGLWQWVHNNCQIQSSFSQSLGIAIGQNKPLRLRLEIRDPNLIALPWEIMQRQAGKQVISLSEQLLFSRTTSDVDPLPPRRNDQALNILLVFGQSTPTSTQSRQQGDGQRKILPDWPWQQKSDRPLLQLEQEAAVVAEILQKSGKYQLAGVGILPVPCNVDTLIQPTPAELIARLETKAYNVFFYGGHGVPAPDGGLLFLQPDVTMSGTELAQVLTRSRVILAVFNACWGAQPDTDGDRVIPRSSLAEVLLHHGVPAVLGMREEIADREALSFIQALAGALANRLPIDGAVAAARQQLVTLYKFNQPAWTLPVLYMHPEFDGELIMPLEEGVTELPENSLSWRQKNQPLALLRSLGDTAQVWQVTGGLMRVGRRPENDIVIGEKWVSQKHAEIICREPVGNGKGERTYWLRDFSRYGTLICESDGWRKIHHQEYELKSGVKLKFGSSQGQMLEFAISATSGQ